jgi:hypothetical protein
MNLARKAGLLVTMLAFVAFICYEMNHFHRFGHYVPLGLHVEVVVTTSKELLGVDGTGKIYNASLTNYGVLPAALTVCDYLDWTSRHQTMVNYIVEKRTPQIGSWEFVREWDDYGRRLFCRPSFEVTQTHLVRRRLWPGQTYGIGEGVPAQMGGFHIGDEGRFTVFLNADNDKNHAISTAVFRVDQEVKTRRASSPD